MTTGSGTSALTHPRLVRAPLRRRGARSRAYLTVTVEFIPNPPFFRL
jgi:hypothetical protein